MRSVRDQFGVLAGLAAGAWLVGLAVAYPDHPLQAAALVALLPLATVAAGVRRWRVWITPLGLACLATLGLAWIQLPFGVNPALSARLLWRQTDWLAAALGLAVIADRPARVGFALQCAALALTAALAADLARLAAALGPDLPRLARFTTPYLMNHPNITSMGAVGAILVLSAACWMRRRQTVVLALMVVALLVNLAYVAIMASRGAQLALLAGAAVCMAALLPRRRWLPAGLAVMLAAALVLPRANPRFAGSLTRAGLADRDKVWRHTWELALERPWRGHGFGDLVFRDVYHAAAPASPHPFWHPHHYGLTVLFVQGFPGLAAQVVLWGLLGLELLRVAVRRRDPWRPAALALLGMLVALHVYGIMDSPTNIVALTLLLTAPLGLAVTVKRFQPARDTWADA